MFQRTKLLLIFCGLLLLLSGLVLSLSNQDIQEITQPCVGEADVVACLEELVFSNPEDAELRGYFALYLAEEGNEERALVEIENALLIDPNNIENHVFRAQLLRKLGDTEAARVEGERVRELRIAQRQKLLTEPVEDVSDLRVQAHLAEVAGEFDAANQLYQRYFELEDNPDPISLSNSAEVLVRLGESQSALETIERAFVSKESEAPETRAILLRSRAWIREQCGDPIGAESDRLEYEATKALIRKEKTASP